MGKCLKIDLNKLTDIKHDGKLFVSFGMNASDGTTGWKGQRVSKLIIKKKFEKHRQPQSRAFRGIYAVSGPPDRL